MRLLVAGGTGSVGISLVEELSKNHKIIATFRKRKGTKN